jgi:hypothetical protein
MEMSSGCGSAGITETALRRFFSENFWKKNEELVLAGMFLFGLVLPKFGQWIGRSEERDLRELLETTLAARVDDSGLPLSVRKIENKPLG